MKKLKLIITGLFLFTLSLGVLAQDPPDPPGEHGSTEDQAPGGTAPVGAGTLLLIGLSAIYGGKKVYDLNKKS